MKIMEKIRHYYNVMGDLSHTNLVLKISLSVLGICFLITVIIIGRLATRPPLIITILPNGKAIPTAYDMDSSKTISESEPERFIRGFLSYKYDWTPENAQNQLKEALQFLTPSLRAQFEGKLSEDLAYIKNTKMTQKLYVKDIEPEDEKPFSEEKTFLVTGDRMIGIRDAKFTTNFRASIALKKEKRTKNNLSGLWVEEFNETLSDEK